MTEAGTCPVIPTNGVVCDLTDIASGWCYAPDCPASAGCSGYGAGPRETCFPVCGAHDAGVSRQAACVMQGLCATDTDCQGSLPHICPSCPLNPQGEASNGCAHWVCNVGQCEVVYCPPGLSCQAGLGCPSYYLPPVDRRCTQDPDCVLVDHVETCCLTIQTAVNRGAQAAFTAIEHQCATTHDPSFFSCGCQGTLANENGASPGPGQSFAAACMAGSCTAVVSGPLQCGAGACDGGQVCCTSADPDGGACIYSCATSCPVMLNDAGVPFVTACRGSP